MVLVFYYKGMLEKVAMQRTQQFSDFSLLSLQKQTLSVHFYLHGKYLFL